MSRALEVLNTLTDPADIDRMLEFMRKLPAAQQKDPNTALASTPTAVPDFCPAHSLVPASIRSTASSSSGFAFEGHRRRRGDTDRGRYLGGRYEEHRGGMYGEASGRRYGEDSRGRYVEDLGGSYEEDHGGRYGQHRRRGNDSGLDGHHTSDFESRSNGDYQGRRQYERPEGPPSSPRSRAMMTISESMQKQQR